MFTSYEGELSFHHRLARVIREVRRVLNHSRNYLVEYPPTPEPAKSLLPTFRDRKPLLSELFTGKMNQPSKIIKPLLSGG